MTDTIVPEHGSRFDKPTKKALIALSITQIISWGTLFYGMMLFGPRIMAETGWNSSFVYSGFTLALLAAGFSATTVGGMIDRHGGRLVMTCGSLLGGFGFIVLALSSHPVLYFTAFLLMGLGMAGSLYDAAFATLAHISGVQTRRAISALTLAGGLASTIFWPIGFWLLGQMQWRMVALVYAGLVGGACAILHFLFLASGKIKSSVQTDITATSTAAAIAEPIPLAVHEIRRSVILFFSCALIAHGVITNALSVHLSPTLDGLGLTEGQAIVAASIIGPAQSAARLLEMLMSTRYPVLALGLISTVLMPLAFAVLIGGAFGFNAVMLFAMLYGASNGLITIARGVVPLALFGRHGYGKTLGLITGPALIAKAVAPLIFAFLLPILGPASMMNVMAGLSFVAFAAMLALVLLVRRKAPS